jgi:hypothetical protein
MTEDEKFAYHLILYGNAYAVKDPAVAGGWRTVHPDEIKVAHSNVAEIDLAALRCTCGVDEDDPNCERCAAVKRGTP